MRTLILAALLAVVSAQQGGTWEITKPNFATIALGVSFQNATSGWVGGSTGSMQPLLLHTTDSGANFTNSGVSDASHLAVISLRMSDAQNGIAGGLGFLTLPCGAITHDGQTWESTNTDLFCAFSSVSAIDADHACLTGSWSSITSLEGNGLQWTSDGGKRFHDRNWNMGTYARYSSFVSPDWGMVAGGMWAEDDQSVNPLFGPLRRLTERLAIVEGQFQWLPPRQRSGEDASGYQAVIAKATNQAQTWTMVANMTGQGFYFNQIDCVDTTNCFVVAEGINKTTADSIGLVFRTTDGGKSWQQVFTLSGGALTSVDFINPSFGWVGGMITSSGKLQGQAFLTTDGGNTWTGSTLLKDFAFFDISTVDENNAYAVGISALGLSSFARFSTSFNSSLTQ